MIIKYHPDRVYTPNTEKNRIRRAIKQTIERKARYIPLTSRAARLFLSFPGVKYVMSRLIKKSIALESKLMKDKYLENNKEENKNDFALRHNGRR